MPWKKLLAWATGQIDEILRQKLEFAPEEIGPPSVRVGLEVPGGSVLALDFKGVAVQIYVYRNVCKELDNVIANLESMPERINTNSH
jgi:hypothetical protein